MTSHRPDSDPALAAEPFCYLTTTGRVSGNPHTIEIWFSLVEGDTLYLLAGAREKSDWVRNLARQPKVSVRIAAHTFDGVARIVPPGDGDTLARGLLVAKYATPANDLAAWGRTALPVAITLTPVT